MGSHCCKSDLKDHVLSSVLMEIRWDYELENLITSDRLGRLNDESIYEISSNLERKFGIRRTYPNETKLINIEKAIIFFNKVLKLTKNENNPKNLYLQKYVQLDFFFEKKEFALIWKSMRNLIKPEKMEDVYKIFEHIIKGVEWLHSLEIYGLDLEMKNLCQGNEHFFPRLVNFLESRIYDIINDNVYDQNYERINDIKKLGDLLLRVLEDYVGEKQFYIFGPQDNKNKYDFFSLFYFVDGNNFSFSILFKHPFFINLNKDIKIFSIENYVEPKHRSSITTLRSSITTKKK